MPDSESSKKMPSIFNTEHGCMLIKGRPVAKRHLTMDEDQQGKLKLELPCPFLSFQSFITHMQATVAMDHAKKVDGSKESLRMNEKLRKKYNAQLMRDFPDSVINAALKQKDFTVPFFIDATKIKEMVQPRILDVNDVSLRTGGNENRKKRKGYAAASTSKPPQVPSTKRKITEGKGSLNRYTEAVSVNMKHLNRYTEPESSSRQTPTPVVAETEHKNTDTFFRGWIPLGGGNKIPPLLPKLPITDVLSAGKNENSTLLSIKRERLSPEPMETDRLIVMSKNNHLKASHFLGCKTCGKTFPTHRDHLFRSHYMIEHKKDPSYEEMRNSKMSVESWFKCRQCSIMLLNKINEHYVKCCSHLPFQTVFEECKVPSNWLNLKCGICKELFETRMELRMHLENDHPDLSKKVILDPFFRCAMCLQAIEDESDCVNHANTCKMSRASWKTTLELAQKLLYCEICKKTHAKIRETLVCYNRKNLFRCLLCLHVSASQPEYFEHAEVYHKMRVPDVHCQLCRARMPLSRITDHLIDLHYNVALHRAGEIACIRGTLQVKANTATQKRNGSSPLGTNQIRPVQQ